MINLAEAYARAAVAADADFGRLDSDLDFFRRANALGARFFPVTARLALGRLEVLGVMRKIARRVLFGPSVCPGVHRLEQLVGFGVLAAGRLGGRFGYPRFGRCWFGRLG